MKTHLKSTALSLLLLMICFSSCTIEKRIYTSGYHIDWKKSHRSADKNSLAKTGHEKQKESVQSVEVIKTELSVNQESQALSVSPKVQAPLLSSEEQEKVKTPTIAVNHAKAKEKGPKKHSESSTFSSIVQAEKTAPKAKQNRATGGGQFNVLALIAFICGLLSFIVLGILPALILGAIALRQFRLYPGYYTNKWMAVIAYVIGVIGCILGIGYLAVFALFIGGTFFPIVILVLLAIMLGSILIIVI
jgi:hypothetical protein